MEIPHFAALRGTERELVILRSETGESWREHHCEHTEEELNQILNGMDEGECVHTETLVWCNTPEIGKLYAYRTVIWLVMLWADPIYSTIQKFEVSNAFLIVLKEVYYAHQE